MSAIVQGADLDVINDGPETAVQIWSITGRRILAGAAVAGAALRCGA